MPAFPWLFDNELTGKTTGKMATLRTLGVPYTTRTSPAPPRRSPGKKEIDALVAYLQQLGTLIQTRR
jgi:cytochrome c oxidase cbb3-type subunit 2